jgi:DNA-binding NtrC family response regulator
MTPTTPEVRPRLRPARILVVEDRESLRSLLQRALVEEGYEVAAVESAEAAIAALGDSGPRPFDLVLTDLKLPGLSGLEVVRAGREARPPVAVVVMTAYGTVEAAVEAMRRGALDFLEKPVEIEALFDRVSRALGIAAADDDAVFEAPDGTRIVGRHPRLRAALHLLERVAPMETTVLLLGDSGTGKELFARALHSLSGRQGAFVALNCAAIPEALLENELFGHERGAFTGADRRQEGRFEAAKGGTLFLDEIGELPLGVQAKLLRVLEDRVVERIGGGRAEKVDVRLVAATNRDLRELAEAGGFRRDLLYRLDVFAIELPALEDRREDIGLLARALLRHLAAKLGKPAVEIDDAAVARLEEAAWPGNVRELSNVLERALILSPTSRLTAGDLETALRPLAGQPSDELRVREALLAAEGDREAAAASLGWSPRTLRRRIKDYGLEGFPKY